MGKAFNMDRRTFLVITALVTALTLLAAGIAAAGVRYDEKHDDVLLGGTKVGGIDVGGMTYTEARTAIVKQFESRLDRQMDVRAGGLDFSVTPRELGVRTDALEKLREASARLRSLPRYERIWMRLRGTSLSRDFQVKTTVVDPDAAQAYLKDVAEKANRAPQEASVEAVGGDLVVHEGQDGYALDWEASEAKLVQAALGGTEEVHLIGEYTEAPERVDTENVIVVDLSDQRLYHYRNGVVLKSYVIVHGGTAYPTPTGTWQISAKRVNPTWRNPAKYPGGWGEHLPSVIGPGWGNPLGTRALNLGNTLIRIHGTYKALSVNESRGCIRMQIPDSEELFERVSVGTTVIVQT